MSASIILEDLFLEDRPPSISSPMRLFEALAQYQLSPSRSLPNELLSYIFLLASHDYEDHYDAIVTPIRISHVCSHWRQVALLTGSLWTNLILAFPVSRPQLSKAITWLNRSQNYPIDILFDFRDPSWDWDEDSHRFRWQDMEAILRLFLSHVQRWRRFELLTDTWAPIFTFLWYTRKVESAPMLESLSLSRCNAYFATKQECFHPVKLKDPIPLFGGLALEKLREVNLTGVHVDWSASKLRNLTSLNFKYHASDVMPTLDEFIATLSACPNLDQLSIIGWGPQFSTVSRGEGSVERNIDDVLRKSQWSIYLPHLTRLLFGLIDTDYAIRLLSLFRLPKLEEISFDDVTSGLDPLDRVDATPLLKWMLDNHDATHPGEAGNSDSLETFPLSGIQTLYLHNIHADEDILSQLFYALRNVRFLALYSAPNGTLHALSPSHSPLECQQPLNPVPCPLLEHLECHHLDPDVLADMVIARATIEYISPLKIKTLATPEHKITAGQRAKLTNANITIVTPIEII